VDQGVVFAAKVSSPRIRRPRRQVVRAFSRPAVVLSGTTAFQDPASCAWRAGGCVRVRLPYAV